MKQRSLQVGLRWLLISVLVLGIGFRFLNLDRKILWHDEVYTSMRSAGYTRHEIDSSLFRDRFIPAPNLQWYQQPKPGSTFPDTIYSLAVEDPQHPPLYFVLSRFWMKLFGSGIAETRLFPALLSLPGIIMMYWLAIELFGSRLAALVAAALLALSPYDILFAQTNRQYSLLTTIVIGSSWLLLQAIRLPTWWNWGLYMLSLALGLYAHPFFALTIAAHGVYVLLVGRPEPNKDKPDPAQRESLNPEEKSAAPRRRLKFSFPIRRLVFDRPPFGNLRLYLQFGIAVLEALILYSPWIAVMYFNRQRALATTDWAQVPTDFGYLIKLWLLSFTSLFVDLDFGFNNPVTYLVRIPFLLLVIVGMVLLYRTAPRKTWLFVLLNFLVPFLLLVLADVLLGGKRSAVSRYLVSCYPAIQLAVAYLFGVALFSKPAFWQKAMGRSSPLSARLAQGLGKRSIWFGILTAVFTASLISCSLSAAAQTWWSKDLSYSNAEVARIINREAETSNPVLVSDIGDDYTNTGDLISLSFRLTDKVRLYTASETPNLDPLAPESNVIFFRPSQKLRSAIEQKGWSLQSFYREGRLWQLKR